MSNFMAGRVRKVALALAASGVASLAMSGPAMAGAFVVSHDAVAGGQGTPVYFWGAQWTQNNAVKGSAPSAFKGYAKSIDSSTLGNCGTSVGWQTAPGSSSPPPATLAETLPLDAPQLSPLGHQYALVVTADRITKSGSTITGSDSNGAQVWLVDVSPENEYAPNAGHIGAGTLVQKVCDAAEASWGHSGGIININ